MKKRYLENIGRFFGRLVVTEYVGIVRGSSVWRFKCDCGSEHRASISNVAKTAPFVRVDAPGQQTPSKSRCRPSLKESRIAPRRALSSVGVHHIERRADRYTQAGRKRLSREEYKNLAWSNGLPIIWHSTV